MRSAAGAWCVPTCCAIPNRRERARRIGGDEWGYKDGGKYICGASTLRAPCVVYSCGSAGDFSFEKSMWDRFKCEVRRLGARTSGYPLLTCLGAAQIHTFDKGEYSAPSYTTFHQAFLGNGRDGTVAIDTFVKQLGHERSGIDIFKADIEYGEWLLLPELLAAAYLPRILLVEFHINKWQSLSYKIAYVPARRASPCNCPALP